MRVAAGDETPALLGAGDIAIGAGTALLLGHLPTRGDRSEYECPGHDHLGCDEYSTVGRWNETWHHAEIVSGVGHPDDHPVGELIELQSHVDTVRRRRMEAEPKSPLALRPVRRNVAAADGRAVNGRAAAVDPQSKRRGVTAGRDPQRQLPSTGLG